MATILHTKIDEAFFGWEISIDPVEGVDFLSITYVLIEYDKGMWLGEVAEWNQRLAQEPDIGKRIWKFQFSAGRDMPPANHQWVLDRCGRTLSEEERGDVEYFIINGSEAPVHEPAPLNAAPLALDLQQAQEGLAEYYRVDPSQIDITISNFKAGRR